MKLNVKDLINVGLFSVLSFIFVFAGGVIGFIPVLMPLVPFSCGILSGPINMLYATRIRKPGMFFIQQLLLALGFFATGHGIFALIGGILSGVIGEYLIKRNNYKSIKDFQLAFCGMSLTFMGNLMPLYINRTAYVETIRTQGYTAEFIDTMLRFMPTWSLIPIFLLGMLGIYLGTLIGVKMLKKHFVKAGMVKGV